MIPVQQLANLRLLRDELASGRWVKLERKFREGDGYCVLGVAASLDPMMQWREYPGEWGALAPFSAGRPWDCVDWTGLTWNQLEQLTNANNLFVFEGWQPVIDLLDTFIDRTARGMEAR